MKEHFEANFTRRTRKVVPVIVDSLGRAYASACEARATFAKAGANENTFGTDVYQFAKHEILAAAESSGVLAPYLDEPQRFRFEAEGFVYACHRVGKSEFDDIQECFPRGKGAASMIHEQPELPMPGLGPDPKLLAAASRVVVAHMGNHEDGLCAVYLCIAAGDAEDEKIKRWEFTKRIWVRSRRSATTNVESLPAARVEPRERKRDGKEAK
jgi:hypothetical protein